MLAGCGGRGGSFMPIRETSEWTYVVNGKLVTGVEKVRVTGRTSVNGVRGFKLVGPMGPSRIAWRGSELIAAELSGVLYDPPVTILDVSGAPDLAKWSGRIRYYGADLPGTVVGTQKETTFTLSGRKYRAIETTMNLTAGGKKIETVATYADTLGLAKLTEHAGGEFLSSMEYLAGP